MTYSSFLFAETFQKSKLGITTYQSFVKAVGVFLNFLFHHTLKHVIFIVRITEFSMKCCQSLAGGI